MTLLYAALNVPASTGCNATFNLMHLTVRHFNESYSPTMYCVLTWHWCESAQLKDVTMTSATYFEWHGEFDTDHQSADVMRNDIKSRFEAGFHGLATVVAESPTQNPLAPPHMVPPQAPPSAAAGPSGGSQTGSIAGSHAGSVLAPGREAQAGALWARAGHAPPPPPPVPPGMLAAAQLQALSLAPGGYSGGMSAAPGFGTGPGQGAGAPGVLAGGQGGYYTQAALAASHALAVSQAIAASQGLSQGFSGMAPRGGAYGGLLPQQQAAFGSAAPVLSASMVAPGALNLAPLQPGAPAPMPSLAPNLAPLAPAPALDYANGGMPVLGANPLTAALAANGALLGAQQAGMVANPALLANSALANPALMANSGLLAQPGLPQQGVPNLAQLQAASLAANTAAAVAQQQMAAAMGLGYGGVSALPAAAMPPQQLQQQQQQQAAAAAAAGMGGMSMGASTCPPPMPNGGPGGEGGPPSGGQDASPHADTPKTYGTRSVANSGESGPLSPRPGGMQSA